MERSSYTVYADLVSAAYSNNNNQPIERVKDFLLLSGMSTNMATVYDSDQRQVVCVAVRGTANWKDVVTDYNLLMSGNVDNSVVEESYAVAKQASAYASKQGFQLVIAGHSLGGTIAIEVAAKMPEKVDAVYSFNMGVPPSYLASFFSRKAWCAFTFNLTDQCKEMSRLAKKTYIFTTGSDPISLFSLMMGATKVDRVPGLNVHTLNNFTSVKANMGNYAGLTNHTADDLAEQEANNPNKAVVGGRFRRRPDRYKVENLSKIWKRAQKNGIKAYTQPLHPVEDYAIITERWASLPEVAKMIEDFAEKGNVKGMRFLQRAMIAEAYSGDFGLKAELRRNVRGERIYNELLPQLPKA